jgi:hypothetical protein
VFNYCVMNLITIIAVLLISLFFTLVFVAGLKSRGPWGSGWSFFSIVCLWLAAVSLWIPPAGPLWFGAPWIDLFVTGLLLSFVLSAMSVLSAKSTKSSSPSEPHEPSDDDIAKPEREKKQRRVTNSKTHNTTTSDRTAASDASYQDLFSDRKVRLRTGGFFWMLLLCLCALIIIGAV